jgi:acyl-CoA dehydrogenase
MAAADPPSGTTPRMASLPMFTDHHRALAAELSAWCVGHRDLLDRVDKPDLTGTGILHALGNGGWLAFLDAADEDYRALCLAREILAYHGDLADFAFSIQALSATAIRRFGRDAQRRRCLPELAAGRWCGAFAISEATAGSDVSAITATGTPDGDGWVLSGRKSWIANAGVADVYTVVVRTGPGPGALGLSAFLVPAETPGLRVEPVELIAPRAFGDLVMDDCPLSGDAMLGPRGGGFAVAMDVLSRFRMTVGAAAVGFARRAMEVALAGALARPMSGGTLFDLPTVRADLADMDVKLDAAALLVARAAWATDRGDRAFGRHSSAAKLYATEAAQEVVDAAVQIAGAAGLVADSPLERLYRQIRSLRIYEGASEVQKSIIASSLAATASNGSGT